MSATILFVDDEDHLRLAASQTMELANLPVQTFADAQAVLPHIKADSPSILVTDIRMPGMDGIALMKETLQIDPQIPVILVTGHGDVEMAVECMRQGAYDFVEKPYDPVRLVETIRRALEKRRLTLENRSLRASMSGNADLEMRLAGQSSAIKKVREQIVAIAGSETDVLITGETGTGKEIAARALHDASERAAYPFVHINCAALPDDLAEIELFGHEAGAFPGATRQRFGKFEHARGGSVLLDDIESLSPPVQAKLLQAINNRTITRLGSNDPVELNVRFIATAKPDIEKRAQAGAFRGDLFYRLSGVQIAMPTLAERREDIPRLFHDLVAQAAVRFGKDMPVIDPALALAIAEKDWPGNVRELKNMADRLIMGINDKDQDGSGTDLALAEQMARHEKSLISAALAANGGSIKQTYEQLQISRKALYEKMVRYGLNKADFHSE